MKLSSTRISSALPSTRAGFIVLLLVLTSMLLPGAMRGQSSVIEHRVPARLVNPIDEHKLFTLKGNVRHDLTPDRDLGPVEDARELHLFLLLQRTPGQEADLQNLIARQQEPTAAEYHKWLTPKEFGERFGAAPEDIGKLTTWLESHGFQVRSVLNNASMIDFAATAGQVRDTFHTQLHYFNVRGGKFVGLASDPQVPESLAPVVAGIKGLNKIPALTNHTVPGRASYDEATHNWHNGVRNDGTPAPAYTQGDGFNYDVTPQDLYTIYNINPVFTAGHLGATATVAVIEESDIEYGTVNSTTGVATGGDVATFRTLFGVPGTLNMHVYHGYGSVTCSDPGIDPSGNGEDIEASLDAEWINATAPSANEIFMSCDDTTDNGIFSSIAALVDNNLSDVMSMSYGDSELNFTAADYTSQDTLYSQAATQGQTFFVSAGDSGSDVKDQNTSGEAVSGINVSAFASPLTTVAGGTDFQDYYDANEGGPAQSTYWGSTNSTYFADALGYIPEMPWNNNCAGSLLAKLEGYSGAGLCGAGEFVAGDVVGGSGGISTHYAAPSWQTGISGYSNSKHSQPDIAGFAASGFWGHALIFCDSNAAAGDPCSGTSTFGYAGGTSFVAPYMAGVAGLLVNYTGERQGLLNPALYALGKAQYTGSTTETACYSNGQTNNIGVTTGLPAAACIFNDVTTGNNDVPCAASSTSCYVNSGKSYGMLSLTGSSSLTVAYQSAPGYDQVTGIGSINVNNLLEKWNTAFSSTTALTATPTSISTTQSTTLKATVTGGTPTGYDGTAPAVAGTVTFKEGSTTVGSCTLSAGTCSASVAGSTLGVGSDGVSAVFSGSGTYPASTSSLVTVTVSNGSGTTATMTSPSPSSTLTGSSVTFSWSAGTNVTAYFLSIGTTGVGSKNIYDGAATEARSAAVTGLPTNAVTVYVRLGSKINGTWETEDYTYTAASITSAMISPVPGSNLTSSSVTFTWGSIGPSDEYFISIGSDGKGSDNLYNPGATTATSASVTGLPTNGETLYVRLASKISGTWHYNDYTYSASAVAATLTTPAPSSTLTGSTVTFMWTKGTGVEEYFLTLGSSGAGSNNLFNPGAQTTTSATATGLPTNGETIYARLGSKINGVWKYTDYTYKAE